MRAASFDPSKKGTLTRTCLNKLLAMGDAKLISTLPPHLNRQAVILLQHDAENERIKHENTGKRHYRVDWRQLTTPKTNITFAYAREATEILGRNQQRTPWKCYDPAEELMLRTIHGAIIEEQKPLRQKVEALRTWYKVATSEELRAPYSAVVVYECFATRLLGPFLLRHLGAEHLDYDTLHVTHIFFPILYLLMLMLLGNTKPCEFATLWSALPRFPVIMWVLIAPLFWFYPGFNESPLVHMMLNLLMIGLVFVVPSLYLKVGEVLGLERCIHFDKSFTNPLTAHQSRMDNLQPNDVIISSLPPDNPPATYFTVVRHHFCICDADHVHVCFLPHERLEAMRRGEITIEDWRREHDAQENHRYLDRDISPDEFFERLALLYDLPSFITQPRMVRLIHEDGSEVEFIQRKAMVETMNDDDDPDAEVKLRNRLGIVYVGSRGETLESLRNMLELIMSEEMDGLTQ